MNECLIKLQGLYSLFFSFQSYISFFIFGLIGAKNGVLMLILKSIFISKDIKNKKKRVILSGL